MREMDPSTSFGAFVSGAPSPTERTGRKAGGVAAIMGHFSRARGLMPGQFATPTRRGPGTLDASHRMGHIGSSEMENALRMDQLPSPSLRF